MQQLVQQGAAAVPAIRPARAEVDAVAVVRHAGARGVVTVLAGTIHSALDVRKVHSYRVDAFKRKLEDVLEARSS